MMSSNCKIICELKNPCISDILIMMKSVLIIDDEKVFRDILSLNLAKQGYKVESAANGQRAIEFLKLNSVDLIILDLKMPQMDGNQFLQSFKSDLKLNIPYIILTNVKDELLAKSSEGTYLNKTEVSLQDIADVVRQIIGEA